MRNDVVLKATRIAPWLVCLVVAGCGLGGDMASVSGKVAFPDGTPLAKGMVIFASKDHTARGQIASDGTFTLGSLAESDGAPPGKYQVYIIGAEEGGYPNPAVSLIADRYTRPETSGIEYEVTAGSNAFEITVEKPSS